MKSKIRVLIVSRDDMLLRIREMMIGAYFHTIGVGRPVDAKAQLHVVHFNLVIICHSLRSEEGQVIAELAHGQTPPAKVLALRPRSEGGEEKLWADDLIGVDAGTFGLLLKCAKMLEYKIRSRSKAATDRSMRNDAAGSDKRHDPGVLVDSEP